MYNNSARLHRRSRTAINNSGYVLELGYTSPTEFPVNNPENVSEWNAYFGLPANGNPFVSVNVLQDVFINQYGFLYNYLAIVNAKNIANTGWDVPEFTLSPNGGEFYDLIVTLGGSDPACVKLKENGYRYWGWGSANNSSGFSARGAGLLSVNNTIYANFTDGFTGIRQHALFWSKTEHIGDTTLVNTIGLPAQGNAMNNTYIDKRSGLPVRLCRPATAQEKLLNVGTPCADYIGNDGKAYKTGVIGNYVYMFENLCETQYRDGSDIAYIEYYTSNAWIDDTEGAYCFYHNNIGYAYDTNSVKLTGASEITIPFSFFESYPFTRLIDSSGIITHVENRGFYHLTNCCEIISEGILSAGQSAFALFPGSVISLTSLQHADNSCFAHNYFIESYELWSLITAGNYCFESNILLADIWVQWTESLGDYCFQDCPNFRAFQSVVTSVQIGNYCFKNNTSLTAIEISEGSTIGSTPGANGVFDGITGNEIQLYIPASLITCNNGDKDGDILQLEQNNTVITTII